MGGRVAIGLAPTWRIADSSEAEESFLLPWPPEASSMNQEGQTGRRHAAIKQSGRETQTLPDRL